MTLREATRIVTAHKQREGGGFTSPETVVSAEGSFARRPTALHAAACVRSSCTHCR